MPTVIVLMKDIALDPENKIDLVSVSPDVAIELDVSEQLRINQYPSCAVPATYYTGLSPARRMFRNRASLFMKRLPHECEQLRTGRP